MRVIPNRGLIQPVDGKKMNIWNVQLGSVKIGACVKKRRGKICGPHKPVKTASKLIFLPEDFVYLLLFF